MSSFTEPLVYQSTEIFRGGRRRPLFVDGKPAIELTGARRLIIVQAGFLYECTRTGRTFGVPDGFPCDLGSIPAFARGLVAPDEPYAQAFVLHDYLYRFGHQLGITRAQADLILWDALGLPFRVYAEGSQDELRVFCPALYRSAIYAAVRLGGAAHFNQP